MSSNVTHSSRCWGFSTEDERVFLLSRSLNVSEWRHKTDKEPETFQKVLRAILELKSCDPERQWLSKYQVGGKKEPPTKLDLNLNDAWVYQPYQGGKYFREMVPEVDISLTMYKQDNHRGW